MKIKNFQTFAEKMHLVIYRGFWFLIIIIKLSQLKYAMICFDHMKFDYVKFLIRSKVCKSETERYELMMIWMWGPTEVNQGHAKAQGN